MSEWKDSYKHAKLQHQFFCCYPVIKMDWESLRLPLNLDDQEALLNATCGHDLNLRWPVRPSHEEAFIKKVLHLLSKQDEVYVGIYTTLCSHYGVYTVAQDYAYKHYVLASPYDKVISLRESNSFVSDGTTGLCTWEAALALTDYLLQPHIAKTLHDKNILELGAGAGFCGISVKAAVSKVGHVLLTDGSSSCVQLIKENIKLNFGESTNEAEVPKSAQLCWEEVNEFQWSKYVKPNLLLAADVVYDETDFTALLKAMDFIFNKCKNSIEMLLSTTVRNESTLEKFMKLLVDLQYQTVPCLNVPSDSSHLCRDFAANVKIIKIKR